MSWSVYSLVLLGLMVGALTAASVESCYHEDPGYGVTTYPPEPPLGPDRTADASSDR